MKAVAVFPKDKRIRLIDAPEPSIESPTQVKLRMLDVGICGTDREIARFEYGSPPPGSPYLVIGHESLARVRETGPAVTRVAPGDLVVTMVRRPCADPGCRACALGRQDFCFTGGFTERGIKGRHGFMTERFVDDERYLHVVPEHLRDVGVLVEPLTIAEKALIQVHDVRARLPWTAAGAPAGAEHGDKAVVLGAGPVGLLGALALLARGYETWVYSLEPENDPKARWAESVGARYLSAASTPLSDVGARIGNVDLFYEATGAAGVAFRALAAIGVNGAFVFTGVPGRKAPIELDAAAIMRDLVLENQLVFGTVNAGPDAFAAAVDDLSRFHARWPGPLAALVTGRHPPDAAPDLLARASSGIKTVVSFAGTR